MKSIALAQYAAWPLMLAIVLALPAAMLMRETYPGQKPPRVVVSTDQSRLSSVGFPPIPAIKIGA